MVNWAQALARHAAVLFERIMADKPHPEMGYRACLGIIRLARQYSSARMEAAAERAVLTGACRYKSVKSILKNSLDQRPCRNPHRLALRRHRHMTTFAALAISGNQEESCCNNR